MVSDYSVSRNEIFDRSIDQSTSQLSKLTGQPSVKSNAPSPRPTQYYTNPERVHGVKPKFEISRNGNAIMEAIAQPFCVNASLITIGSHTVSLIQDQHECPVQYSGGGYHCLPAAWMRRPLLLWDTVAMRRGLAACLRNVTPPRRLGVIISLLL